MGSEQLIKVVAKMLTRSDLFLKKNKIDQLFCNINFNDFFAFIHLSFSGKSSFLSMMVKLSCSTKKIITAKNNFFKKAPSQTAMNATGCEHLDLNTVTLIRAVE